jgi:hypothetical protein
MDQHTFRVIHGIRMTFVHAPHNPKRPTIVSTALCMATTSPTTATTAELCSATTSVHQTAPPGKATRRLRQSGRQRQHSIPTSTPPLGVRGELTLRSSPSVVSSEGDIPESPRCASFSGQQHPGCTITLAQHRPSCLPSEGANQPNTSCYIFGVARHLPLWFRLRTRIAYLLRRPPSTTSEGAGPCTGRHYA